jgi:predicted porin
MKKSLVALAVLAASGASFAQSNVTLYGLADLWVGSQKVETAGVSTSTTVMKSGGVNGSRWGMKGSEDLGGGLKANFNYEAGVALDTGAASGFSRQSYVGFSGGFGEVKLGKVWTAYDDVSGASDAVFDSALAPMNNVFLSTGYAGNPSNTIYYASPTMGGFAGAFSYSLEEKAIQTPTDVAETTVTSLNLTYGAGPLAAQFGYQKEDNNLAANDTSFTRLGASYDFGVATAKLVYGKTANIGNVSGADATEWSLGADVPVGPALTLSAAYAKSTDNAAAGNEKRTGFGFAGAYTLSKRTFLYGGYTNAKADLADSKTTVFALGVQHKF